MRVLILMSDTGGGHRSCAIALQQEFARLPTGRHQVDFIDIYRFCAPRPFCYLPDIYPLVVNHWPALWQWTFETYGPVVTEEFIAALCAGYCQPYFALLLQRFRPDLIITVNPLLLAVLFRVLDALDSPIPVASVVSDLIAPHSTWFHPRLELVFVPTASGAAAARLAGVPAAAIRVYGLPVRREFIAAERDKPVVKAALGFRPDLPLLLVTGGGEGMGSSSSLLSRLMAAVATRSLPDLQVAVICGRNEEQRKLLQARFGGPKVRIAGYVDNMHDWMAASDVAITKAGPNTIMEAAAIGLPLIVSSFILGQEQYNPAFVRQHRLGCFAAGVEAQLDVLTDWLWNPDEMPRHARQATAATPAAGALIVRELALRYAG